MRTTEALTGLPDPATVGLMHWEERLLALFDDLEQQAEGLALSARDAEVAELGRAEYAQVDLGSRLHGSLGRRVGLVVTGIGPLDARLGRVGSDWCLAEAATHEWLVRLAAVTRVGELGQQAVDPRHRALGARLGFGSALRGVAEDGAPVLVHLLDGTQARGWLRRVGADFLELRAEQDVAWGDGAGGRLDAVPFAAVAGVRATT